MANNSESDICNDYGLTFFSLIIIPFLSLKYKKIFQTKIKYIYGFILISWYKSLSVYNKKKHNNKILNFFGNFNFLYLITPSLRKKYDYLRFNYLDKIFRFSGEFKKK